MSTKVNFKFPEQSGAAPKEAGHYQFDSLSNSEKLLIRLVYWKMWRHMVVRSRLSRNQASYAKRYFYELHARYYHTVVKGGQYVTVVRLIRNFFLSKAQENLRAVLTSIEPYNLTSFVQGVRSQIEINALLHKFLIDPDYHKEHFSLNEDRARVKELKTAINVNTLISGLDKSGTPLPYAEIYDALSLLLHPNPSAIKFYAQAERRESRGSGPMQPQIKFYFDKTISHTQSTADWFSQFVWTFLTCMEHFLILFDGLKAEFYLNEEEAKEHQAMAMAAFVAHNQTAILNAVNNAGRLGGDIEAATREIIARLMDEQMPKASDRDSSG